jgi:hypothetical protein
MKTQHETLLRRSYWWIAHRWAQVRTHRTLVVGSVLGGALFGLLLSSASPTSHIATVVIDTGVIGCQHGFPLTETCSWCEEAKLPLSVRWARGVDREAMRLGFHNPNLEAGLAKASKAVMGR